MIRLLLLDVSDNSINFSYRMSVMTVVTVWCLSPYWIMTSSRWPLARRPLN